VIARHDYIPFGEEIPSGIAGRNSQFDGYDNVNQKFTGKERDTETSLDFFQARYYGAGMGRFTSADPLAGLDPYDPQSWDAYAYGRNNPLSYVDPTGESYQICDANWQNCTDKKNELTDDEFASEKKLSQANGEVFSNGTLSHTDANGNTVVDGTYRQTDVDTDGNAADNQRGARQIGATSAVGDPLLQITLGFIMGPGSAAMEGPLLAGGVWKDRASIWTCAVVQVRGHHISG